MSQTLLPGNLTRNPSEGRHGRLNLEPFKLVAQRRPNIIVEKEGAGELSLDTTNLRTSKSESLGPLVIAESYGTSILRTTYGLELSLQNSLGLALKSKIVGQHDEGAAEVDSKELLIFFRAGEWFWNKDREGNNPGDLDDHIKERIPILYAAYQEWREILNAARGSKGCGYWDLEEMFPDTRDRVAVETEGLMMATFLILQPHVSEVRFACCNGDLLYLRKDVLELNWAHFLKRVYSLKRLYRSAGTTALDAYDSD